MTSSPAVPHPAPASRLLDAERAAVIDLGSNSSRAVIVQPLADGCLQIIDEVRAPLRLGALLDASGALPEDAIAHTIEVMADFIAVAHAAGAVRTIALGTAALRRATNAAELLERLRSELHLEVEVIDAAAEGTCSFYGAVHGLPVEHGLVLDVGGGSVELVAFEDRVPTGVWSFPLGALWLTAELLDGDPPSAKSVSAARALVLERLKAERVPRLSGDAVLVGTGGTVRNLAKIDRRSRRYPVTRLHGYELSRPRLRRQLRALAGKDSAARAAISGLNPDRATSIVGGAIAVEAVLSHCRVRSMLVSGQGLREGAIRRALGTPLPAPAAVRRASVDGLRARFTAPHPERSARRAQTALAILDALSADHGLPLPDAELRELLEYAALLLDVGWAVDFYNRHREASAIVLDTDLAGFSHRMVALLSDALQRAERAGRRSALVPLLTSADEPGLEQVAAILGLADDIERRRPPLATAPTTATIEGATLRVRAALPALVGELDAVRRLADATGLDVQLSSAGG